MTAPENPALERYRTHAERLGRRFNGLAPEMVLRSVADHLPRPPARVLDIGAGSGRDAAWFAREGYRVTAVEPVPEMSAQSVGLDGAGRIEWITDQLPGLSRLHGRETTYDFCLLSGVWHHLAPAERPAAMARLAELLAPGGRMGLSLRLGPEADGLTIHAVDADETIAAARDAGLALLHRADTPSVHPSNIAAGVTWTWLVLERL